MHQQCKIGLPSARISAGVSVACPAAGRAQHKCSASESIWWELHKLTINRTHYRKGTAFGRRVPVDTPVQDQATLTQKLSARRHSQVKKEKRQL